ncbi:unnamed protein product (macronuclear) [Paramecium tetraurelia]|uniref:Transmembrane protein n=1 Tax=Paramecium tetraurelia TaxID=5888 RepID=A0CAM4_PARTE|nr:uncharacterized protein GSPATT00036622001 [Paramecium tetraurelia]CAK67841.1 unnamed protein product [Paramecium tetraurelia]|eukprot:XP_001435238.1 hypothetical protein (macronuclear) [Paramecium tetraurelia strain d4-2]
MKIQIVSQIISVLPMYNQFDFAFSSKSTSLFRISIQNVKLTNQIQQNYIPKLCDKIGNFKPDHKPILNQISCLYSNAVNYRDCKKQYHGLIGPINVYIDKKLPPVAKTSYTQNFITKKYEKQDPIIQKQLYSISHYLQRSIPESSKTLIRDTTQNSILVTRKDNTSTKHLVYRKRNNPINALNGSQILIQNQQFLVYLISVVFQIY